MSIREKIKQVNAILKSCEPRNIEINHVGQAGYKPQAIIDAMNQVFEYGSWGFEEISNETFGDVKNLKTINAIAQVKAWIADDSGKPIAFSPTAHGGGEQPIGRTADTKKAAQTDAIKKALSYFSIGNRAYWGALRKENQK